MSRRRSEIHQLAEHIKINVVARRNARGGRGAAELLIAALRCLYRHAENDGHIPAGDNPARKVDKPRRLPSTRRAVPDTRLAEINQIAATTGNDPALDALLLRLHTETACRRGGALALQRVDLDPDQCLIRLREKGETVRWQPVSPTLMAYLLQHAEQRGAPAHGQLLRYADGRPITSRRYDHLWARIGRQLPWVATQQISTHWLRHTTLTWVERNFGYAVARAYAGQTALILLEQVWNRDLSGYDPDGPLPDVDPDEDAPPIIQGRAFVHQDRFATVAKWREIAEAKQLSLRELVIDQFERGPFVGTAAQVAAALDDFVQNDGSDGVILGSHLVPWGLDEFVDQVVPLLQERGSLRAEYTGSTLRDNPRLPVPDRARIIPAAAS